MLNCKEVGRKPPNFGDASIVATELLNSGYEFDQGSVIYNRFRYDTCSTCFSLSGVVLKQDSSGLISPFFAAGLLSHTRRTSSLCFPSRRLLTQVVSALSKELLHILRRPIQKYTEYMCFVCREHGHLWWHRCWRAEELPGVRSGQHPLLRHEGVHHQWAECQDDCHGQRQQERL